jgi:hypothetical protein
MSWGGRGGAGQLHGGAGVGRRAQHWAQAACPRRRVGRQGRDAAAGAAAHRRRARRPQRPPPPPPSPPVLQGTLNLVSVAKRAGVKRFVLVTSIGTDDTFNFLNLFWGVCGSQADDVAARACGCLVPLVCLAGQRPCVAEKQGAVARTGLCPVPAAVRTLLALLRCLFCAGPVLEEAGRAGAAALGRHVHHRPAR